MDGDSPKGRHNQPTAPAGKMTHQHKVKLQGTHRGPAISSAATLDATCWLQDGPALLQGPDPLDHLLAVLYKVKWLQAASGRGLCQFTTSFVYISRPTV